MVATTNGRIPQGTCPSEAQNDGDGYKLLPVDQIDPNPHNARTDWDGADVAGLATSIQECGLVQAVVVRPTRNGRFQLVAGERRWRAAQHAGRKSIRAIVRNLDDRQAAIQSLTENLHRKNLNPLEKARGIEALLQQTGQKPGEVARLFGHKRTWVVKLIRLLRLPEAWQQRVARGELGESFAQLLIPHADNPAVLAAVEKGMEQEPCYWETRAQFERSLQIIIDHPAAGSQEDPPAARKPRLTPAAARANQPADAAGELLQGKAAVDRICELLTRLTSVEDVAAVKEAADLRLAHLKRNRVV